jgi:hypothetical protein
MMKNILVLIGSILIAAFFISSNFKSSGGKAGNTGSPGENTCTQCHNSFSLNEGTGSLTLSNTKLEDSNWVATKDSTYIFEVNISHTDAAIFGFGVEALNKKGENSGILSIENSSETQLMNANVGGISRTNITHKKNAGLSANSKTFTFKWTATSAADTTTFYVVGNAANNSNNPAGDYIYSTSQVVTRVIDPSENTSIFNKLSVQTKVYPNPASDIISIELPENTPDYVIHIFNAAGQLVTTELFNVIKITEYPKGIYLISVLDINKKPIASSRFIKI